MTVSTDLLRVKLGEALTAPPPHLTRRGVRVRGIAGKPLAVIGVRRGGKTSFLHHRRAERIAAGRPRESQVLLEDERLVGMTAMDLGWVIEEHARQFPALRAEGLLSLYFDEIQIVAGWESLVHQLVEARDVEIIVSGSSAKLLSREVATALRGRLMEVLIHPCSFREALRHVDAEPSAPWHALSPSERAALDARLRDYLQTGGFPEAQGTEFRDLSTPAGSFTVHKFYQALKSQGLAVSKDILHAYLRHLQDAFLTRLVDMHSASERQRMVNPRKVYRIDPGLIPLYELPGRTHRGRSLETAVLLELERREYDVSWLRIEGDREIDCFASRAGDAPLLRQICLDTTDSATWDREIQALSIAASVYPDASAMLITMDHAPPTRPLPGALRWRSATDWLLSTND